MTPNLTVKEVLVGKIVLQIAFALFSALLITCVFIS